VYGCAALLPSGSYASGMPIDSAALPDDVDALKRIIGELTQDAVAARAEIEKLRFKHVGVSSPPT